MSRKLTVFFTSDTHGYLYPTNFHDQTPRPMGLLSMRFPKDENTLIIDGGDTIQGSPLTYFCRTAGQPLPVAKALNDRKYDFVTLGNHDFNQGQDTLAGYLRELNAQCLCANVKDEEGRLELAPWAIRTMGNGIKVGLIGIVTPWVNRWEKKKNLTGIMISDPLEAAKKAADEIRPLVDVLIGIYHGGIERNTMTGELLSDTDENIGCRLCEEITFDLLLTGHQHAPIQGISWHGTHIVQPPCNAEAYIRVEMDDDGIFSSELCTVPNHADLTPEEADLWEKLNVWLDTPVGYLNRSIWPEDHLTMALEGNSIADFFNIVQLDASGAQISCAALANSVRGFNSAVTVRDVVASYVYTNTLVVLEVTGVILRKALEQCATFFSVSADGKIKVNPVFYLPKEAYFNYDYFYGIEYTFDLTQPVGSRVSRLEYQGQQIEPEQRFTLCMCDYRATGAGDFDFYCECPRVKEFQTDVSELILDYLHSRPLVSLPESHAFHVIYP